MWRKLVKLIFIILLLLATTGCWDSLDVNKRNIMTAVLLDYKDDEYHFYSEVATVQKSELSGEGQSSAMGGAGQGSVGSEQKVAILHGSGSSLAKARFEVDSKADNPVFISSVRTMIFSGNFAQRGIEVWMNRIRELREYRQTMRCVTSSCDPNKLLSATTKNAPSTGFGIDLLLENLYNNGQIVHISSEDVLEKMVEEYTSFLIPFVDVVEEKITFKGYSVFKDDRSIGFIPKADANSIVSMLNPKYHFEYVVPYQDNLATVDVTLAKKKIKPLYSNGSIKFSMKFNFDGEYLYSDKNITFNENVQNELKQTLQKILADELENMISTSQEQFKCDYLGFNDIFRIAYPQEYSKMDWSSEYTKASISISVEVDLKTSISMDYDLPIEKTGE